ncbi:MAG: AMP-binding protein [Flavobacteriales bacterium]|nr:AMP-binding protein [Flavobacteriales bacterium]
MGIRTPQAMLRQWAHEKKDHVFLTQITENGSTIKYTWSDAYQLVQNIASWLKHQNYEPGSRIAIMSKNCAQWVLSDLAIWEAGMVSVPLYPLLGKSTTQQILRHSEAKAIFIGSLDEPEPMLEAIPTHVDRINFEPDKNSSGYEWRTLIRTSNANNIDHEQSDTDLATIIYTSGTTGTPKGVMHSFATLFGASQGVVDACSLTHLERYFSYLPLAHAAERCGIEMTSLLSGGSIYFGHNQDTFFRDLVQTKPTVFISVPRLWGKFQQALCQFNPNNPKAALKKMGLDSVRVAFSGAAPIPPDILTWFHNIDFEILEGYGMTEFGGVTHANLPGKIKIGTVGVTLGSIQHKISEEGEVLVKSQSNTPGYYQDVKKTHELYSADGFIRTGDKGEIDNDGYLRITGRFKEIFKTSKGKYISPAPIENMLGAHPQVDACCVVGEGQPQPCAIITLSENQEWGEEILKSMNKLRERTNRKLDKHEQINYIVVTQKQWNVDNGFVTPTLKVKRHVIESHYGANLNTWEKMKQPVIFYNL